MFTKRSKALDAVREHGKRATKRGWKDIHVTCNGFIWSNNITKNNPQMSLGDYIEALKKERNPAWAMSAIVNQLDNFDDETINEFVCMLELGQIKILLKFDGIKEKLNANSKKYIVKKLKDNKSHLTLGKHKWLIQDGQ